MIAGIAFLNRPNGVAESPLLAVKILVALLRDGQAEIALPLLVLSGILFVLLAEKVLVLALGNVKRDNQDFAPAIFLHFGVENFRHIAASRQRLTCAHTLLDFQSIKCFHCLFPPVLIIIFFDYIDNFIEHCFILR